MFFNDINVQRRSLLFADRADFPLSRRKQGFESPRERQITRLAILPPPCQRAKPQHDHNDHKRDADCRQVEVAERYVTKLREALTVRHNVLRAP
jgi:hypothetical protein